MQRKILPVFLSCILRQSCQWRHLANNVKKNVRKIAGDYLTVCDLVLHAEHVSLQMWQAVARGMFQSISWSWHALRRIHLIYQQIVYADWLERASSNRPHVFSQGRAKVMCCSSGIWQSTYDQNSVLFKNFRSLPGIFRVTNQQNNRPILGGGGLPNTEDTVGLFYSWPTGL